MTDTHTTTATTTRSLDEVVSNYFEAWNEPDPARRRELVASVFADDGRPVDPRADVRGHDEVAAMIAGVQERFPGHSLIRTSGLDAHHDRVRYGWRLQAPDGSIVVTALDVVELADDGRMRCVAAFFHDLPAGEG
jgi:hypothetical protein